MNRSGPLGPAVLPGARMRRQWPRRSGRRSEPRAGALWPTNSRCSTAGASLPPRWGNSSPDRSWTELWWAVPPSNPTRWKGSRPRRRMPSVVAAPAAELPGAGPSWATHGGSGMIELVLLRHGESLWNRENRFTGWTDVDLTEQGIAEAHEAARLLAAEGYTFDLAFTSVLKRAIRTLWIVLDDLDLMWIPIHNSWRLNERHYGALQGLNKAEMAARFGEEQVRLWRRSYDVPPPPLDPDDPRFPGHDPR